METLCLYVEVPICAFRPRWAREYQETYALPPPATVFGMLLSLTGVDWPDKEQYAGVELALALTGEPEKCRIFRKFRRVPQANKDADPLLERRPDYQDLLMGLEFWLWLRDGQAKNSLTDRVRAALEPYRRQEIQRYGGLSLGESTYLINVISLKKQPEGQGRYLRRDPSGYYQLPIWVQHPRCGNGQSRLGSFSISPLVDLEEPPEGDNRWIIVPGPQRRPERMA
ncbi:MAG: type I-MYXAN CRISPR-associated protein Cas5/Cmx5/DevS [Deltaproteobacteria bacterium]|nr:type I-MYXAN CRISPR-associated protein Cas5/Cmx5/DevS [Deltaproteobacteria bacterium]